MTTTIKRKARVALVGGANSPKLYAALQIAFGLTGNYQRIIVIDSTGKADRYSILGDYHVCEIHPQSTPDRYSSLLNIVQGTPHDAVILDLTSEWRSVTAQVNEYNYQQVLRSHRTFMQQLKFSCTHIIALVDSERKLAYRDKGGNCKLHFENRIVQMEGVENFFTTVLRLDRKGYATTEKDLTGMLPKDKQFKPDALSGAVLHDWCSKGRTVVPEELQKKIDACTSLGELYNLLFSSEVTDAEMVSAFTQKRIDLEAEFDIQAGQDAYPF
ncbi:MAG: hypothetical protein EOP48_15970 [Sphingobacteriales bacterium]|nr:MAG: hypothetical protein EOP48_15970 [Sphingobacteriales bacterium]